MIFKTVAFILAMMLNFYVFLTEGQSDLTQGIIIAISGLVLVVILNTPSSSFERKNEKDKIK